MNGSAPKVLSRMTSGGVPFMGIAVTGALTLVGIFMNLVIPAEAFETALDLAALGIISSWATIVICQIQLYRWSQRGILQRGSFRMPGAPYTGYLTLAFLAAVVVLMCYENAWNLIAIAVLVPVLTAGWYLCRGRVLQLARERIGYTGAYPVIAHTPCSTTRQANRIGRDRRSGTPSASGRGCAVLGCPRPVSRARRVMQSSAGRAQH